MRIRNIFVAFLLTALPALSQIPTNAPVVLERVPYTQPMWSRADPFGFTTLSNASIVAEAAAITAAVGVALSPRVTVLESYTNDIYAAYFLATTNNTQVAALRASSPFWDSAYQIALSNANKIATLQGSSATWDAAFALATTNSSRLGVLEGLQAYWTAAYYLSVTNASSLNTLQASVDYAIDLANALSPGDAMTRLLDTAGPSTNWVETTSNKVFFAAVTPTVFTNYQWYVRSTADVIIDPGAYYDSLCPATNTVLLAANSDVALVGATNFLFASGDYGTIVRRVYYAGGAPANGDSGLAVGVYAGQIALPLLVRDNPGTSDRYASAPYYDNTRDVRNYTGDQWLLVTNAVYAWALEFLDTDRVFNSLGDPINTTMTFPFSGYCSRNGGTHPSESHYAMRGSPTVTVSRVDTPYTLPGVLSTNRTDLLVFTNGMWAAVNARVLTSTFDFGTNSLTQAMLATNATTVGMIVDATNSLSQASTNLVPYSGADKHVDLSNVSLFAPTISAPAPGIPNGFTVIDTYGQKMKSIGSLWLADTQYNIGDTVNDGLGTVFSCVTPHVSGNLYDDTDLGYWAYGFSEESIDWGRRRLQTPDVYGGGQPVTQLDWSVLGLLDAGNNAFIAGPATHSGDVVLTGEGQSYALEMQASTAGSTGRLWFSTGENAGFMGRVKTGSSDVVGTFPLGTNQAMSGYVLKSSGGGQGMAYWEAEEPIITNIALAVVAPYTNAIASITNYFPLSGGRLNSGATMQVGSYSQFSGWYVATYGQSSIAYGGAGVDTTTLLFPEDPSTTKTIATREWVGSHGYLTAESDTLATVTARGATTTNSITAGSFIGNGSSLTNVDASTLAGYDIDAIMAVGSTYFFNTNFISYGAITGREASLTVPSVGGYLTYAGPVTNGQYLNSYLIPADQMPALISKGTKATFEFYGGHAGTPSHNPTIMGDFYIMNTNGTVVQEFESPVMVIPRGEDYFKLEITFTNDVVKDGYAFLLKTRIIDRDSYPGDFTSYFGKPYYTGFSFPKSTGVFTPQYVHDAHAALSLKAGAHDGANVITNNQTGVTLNTMAINNGFREQYEQNLTFDSATRVMTIIPTNGIFKITAGGVTHSFTSSVSSSAAPLSDDLYFYVNTAGQFIGTNVAWTINGEAQVAYVKLFTNDSSVVFTVDERHGVNISDEWHRQQHFTVGTKWSSGLSLFHNASDTATASLASGIGTCISIADGIIYDEDVKHQTVTNGIQSNAGIATNTAGVFPILYRNTNQQWIRTAGTSFPFLWSGNIPQVSSNGVVSNVAEDQYFVYWVVTLGGFRGTNCFLIPHPVTYTSTALAQSGASPYTLGTVLGNLPSTEMLVSHRLIFQYNASNPNANPIQVKYAKLRDVTDFRALSSGVIVAGTPGATSQIVHNDTFGRDVASTHPASSIDVTFTPTNYTASASNVESHLGGIDTRLGRSPFMVYSNLTGSITLTNNYEAPISISGTGSISVAFSGLVVPYPVYFTAQGFSSLTFPSGSYLVGGGMWQTNRVNHFVIWQYSTNLYVNPVVTTEIE